MIYLLGVPSPGEVFLCKLIVEWNRWPSQQWVPTITITIKRKKEMENNNNNSSGGGLSLIRASDGTNQNEYI